MHIPRPSISSTALSLIVACYLLFLLNNSFWSEALAYFADDRFSLIVAAAILILAHFAALLAFSAQYVIKPVFIALILIGAAASYFVDAFGTVIDRDMIANVLDTTSTEAGHLITPAYLLHVLIYGVVPAALVAWVRIIHRPFWSKVRRNTVAIIGCLALAGGLLAANFAELASVWRAERERMMSHLVPATPLVGAISLGVRQFRAIGVAAKPLGVDARQGDVIEAAAKPVLTVIVVGETARAQNFSLNGYPRKTNPELEARDVVNFTNVTSCGTATAVSLPCMFSNLGRAGYTNIRFRASENLVDVLKHAGLQVYWWENNSGPKEVANRIPTTSFYGSADARYCREGECLDDILVDHLKAHIDDFKGNSVLVLHSGGSHGPAYYLRYPENFGPFRPDCRSPQLSDCSDAEIVNAYDNSIAYTDLFLAHVIDTLKSRPDIASALIYMSDHGESLGEDGVYLHGLPYFVAPETQTHIPMIAWFSDAYAAAMKLDIGCAKGQTAVPLSHDNLFSTILGLMDVRTSVYSDALDAFSACRPRRDGQTAATGKT